MYDASCHSHEIDLATISQGVPYGRCHGIIDVMLHVRVEDDVRRPTARPLPFPSTGFPLPGNQLAKRGLGDPRVMNRPR